MRGALARRVLPETQRRTLLELTEDLDLDAGDTRSKRSAFWTMLTLSAVIATAGVLADSTATVIGAMIIAPLSTPIMGIALGVAKRTAGSASRASRYVLGGAGLVIGVGLVFGLVLPSSFDLLGNSQITGRTSPGLVDLIAAVATGFAGAIALARRDVAAVLPGVAIAISLVPPLAVVGVCLGETAYALAFGALLLFLSNLIALVLAGTLVFTVLGYSAEAVELGDPGVTQRKAWLTIGVLLVLVIVPLVGNTLATIVLSVFTQRAKDAAEEWISAEPGASIQSVEFRSTDLHVLVQTPGDLPQTDDLLTRLAEGLPSGVPVVVQTSLCRSVDAGTIGQD